MRLTKPLKHVRPQCRGCRHYYVTWESRHPHGCRAMGFKSQRTPCLEVIRSTPGVACLHFKPRS
ncbi:MAG: uracil-DNA glycosylase [Deltaproteobacteria bacterium]|nr:uracil-DNA glycosylase [Deltaproteobacteria bacterium]